MNSLITQDRSHLAYRGLDDRSAGRATCLDRESRCTKTNAMNVKRNGRQSMKCEACDDTGWVCETHEADQPLRWQHQQAGWRAATLSSASHVLSSAKIVSNRPAKCCCSQRRDRYEYDVQACADDGYRSVA
jgi:hypothetical protein